MRTCVIFNPTAKGDKARRFRRHLDEIGAQCTLMQTSAAGDAARLATGAVISGFEIVVAAGGDGTVNEVLNGIGAAPGGFDRTRLGVLPLGTVNVFARELGISTALQSAWKSIRNARESVIDLPQAEFTTDNQPRTRYFAQLAGAGLDARAIQQVQWGLKKRFGPLAYVAAGLNALRAAQSRITVSAGTRCVTGELILIGNGKLYGGPYRIFPNADLRDGLLEVCVFPKVNWLTLARCGPGLLWSGTLPPSVAVSFQARAVTLSASEPAPFEVDGELAGHLPVRMTLAPARLRVVIP